jgi:hypothetical protein
LRFKFGIKGSISGWCGCPVGDRGLNWSEAGILSYWNGINEGRSWTEKKTGEMVDEWLNEMRRKRLKEMSHRNSINTSRQAHGTTEFHSSSYWELFSHCHRRSRLIKSK